MAVAEEKLNSVMPGQYAHRARNARVNPMRSRFRNAPIAFLIAAGGLIAADPATAERVAAVAQVQRKLPWFWSAALEGIADIPYTYEVRISRRILTGRGKEIPPNSSASALANWRTLQLERIPLDWGAFLRCVSQDGASRCSKEWDEELERQTKRRDDLSPDERARIDRTREERRQRRRDFWDRFPAAFDFSPAAEGQLRFSPLPRGKDSGASLLGAVKGAFWFDLSTNEIIRMEYELVRDVDDLLLRRQRGARFQIELSKSADERYLPRRIWTRQKRGKADEFEESASEYSKFRRFGSESSIKFGDSDPPAKR